MEALQTVYDTEEIRFRELGQAALKRLEGLELPAEDGIPLESNWHRIQMNLLIDSIHSYWQECKDFFAGGNMFIYFSIQQALNQDYRGPDFFVVKNTDGTLNRDSWVVWAENGKYPNVIVELASPSTFHIDLGEKKYLYEQTFRTREYFCYDPQKQHLYGWRLNNNGVYEELKADKRGCLWSQELELWLGRWEGELLRVNTVWLRFYEDECESPNLVLTRAEAEAERAEKEAARADIEAQRAQSAEDELAKLHALLKEKGINL